MLDLKRTQLFLFDMDGTLYLGEQLFSNTVELLKTIRAQGKQYLFLTNNSSKSVDDYVQKMNRLGVDAEKSDFLTSAQATAGYLFNHYPNGKIFVAGTSSFCQELRNHGLSVTEEPEKDIACIVCGFDTELTFQKLDYLSRLLLRKEVPFIATNPDLVCPTEYGFVPDCGSVCEMLFHATGRKPFVIGKPSPLMPQLACQKYGCTPDETLMIGDRLYTDIACGLNANIPTLLVLSGETTAQMAASSEFQANAIMQDIGELLQELKKIS